MPGTAQSEAVALDCYPFGIKRVGCGAIEDRRGLCQEEQ